MDLMNLFLNWLVLVPYVTTTFINAKILTRDWKWDQRESVFIAFSSLFVSSLMVAVRVPGDIVIHQLVDIVVMFFLFLYLKKIKYYSIKNAFILAFPAIMVIPISQHILNILYRGIFSSYFPYLTPSHRIFAYFLTFVLPTSVLSALLSILVVKSMKKMRNIIKHNVRVNVLLAAFSVCIFLYMFVRPLLFLFLWYSFNINFGFLPYSSVFTLLVVFFGVFYVYTQIISSKHEKQRKEDEYQSLQHYTDELERYQTAVRNFEHDYRNILSSLDSFIEEDDFAGLKQYYKSKIKVVSETITHNHFALEALNKIKIREIKGVLSSKLMFARSEGIDAVIETEAEIDHIPVDTVILVRMLGIIMDNAIEELVSLEHGILRVGCFKDDGEILFIVQNTCRPDMPSLRQLRQSGFSTKGKKRGLGMSNLFELSNLIPNLILDTNIVENNFIQRITIVETEGSENV